MKLKPIPSLILCALLFLGGFAAGRLWALRERQAVIEINVLAQEEPYRFHVPMREFLGGKR